MIISVTAAFVTGASFFECAKTNCPSLRPIGHRCLLTLQKLESDVEAFFKFVGHIVEQIEG
jgi:hypothetical protein